MKEYNKEETKKLKAYFERNDLLVPGPSIIAENESAKMYEVSSPYNVAFIEITKNGEKTSEIIGPSDRTSYLEFLAELPSSKHSNWRNERPNFIKNNPHYLDAQSYC